MAEATFKAEADLHVACSLKDLEASRKKRITVHGRDIFIVKAKEKLYALDSFCYHLRCECSTSDAGGPLHNGDIEELGGRLCVVCPWHKYKVCVDTGQNYYQSIDPRDLKKPARWTVGDVRQRTHRVVVQDGRVYVALSQMDGTLDSDHHNTRTESGT